MSTVIRSEISKANPYYISKHRYLELKHFCLQYNEWKEEYKNLLEMVPNDFDPTSKVGTRLAMLSRRMEMVQECAKSVDEVLGDYIFDAVTGEHSYTYERQIKGIPCCRSVYYDLYRKFMFELGKRRE